MRFDTLALVGVGLLGGSIGLAARRRGVVRRVVGTDHDPAALGRAVSRGILDASCADLAGVVAAADLVVFCTPVDRIGPQILAAAPHCRPGTLLSDVGSTKAGIVRLVEGRLPAGVVFVGSHPLAGSEKHGHENADAGLFDGRLVVLTPCGEEVGQTFLSAAEDRQTGMSAPPLLGSPISGRRSGLMCVSWMPSNTIAPWP